MSARNPLLVLILSSSLLMACGPDETSPPSQNSLAEIESRLARVESDLNNPAAEVSGEAVQQIAVQPPAFALNVGSTKKIELVTLTTASGEKTVLTGFNVLEMSVEDTEIASVSATGEVTGLKAGTTILEIGLGKNKKSLPVVVLEGEPTPNPTPTATPTPETTATPTPTPTPTATPLPSNSVKAVSISPSSMTLDVNDTGIISRIFVTLNDAEETIGALNSVDLAEFSSSNSSVATVSKNGVVTSLIEGTATITATYKGVKGTLDVTVEEED